MPKRAILAAALVLSTAACGGAQRSDEAALLPLGQARAVELIEAAIAARELGSTATNVAATLSNGTRVNVDVLARPIGAGYVYMNEQDRRDYGPIPERVEGSELHAVLARLEAGEQVHLLVLQDRDYEYLPTPRADRRRPEEITIDYVEGRLRRDALDFAQAIVDLRGGAE